MSRFDLPSVADAFALMLADPLRVAATPTGRVDSGVDVSCSRVKSTREECSGMAVSKTCSEKLLNLRRRRS